jgi:hypothetical protein
MEKHTFLSVLAVTLVALAVAMFIPGKQAEKPSKLPWQIELTPSGTTRVFGAELGKTTLSEVEVLLGEPAEVSLFARDDGQRAVEAYFDSVDLSGLRARMVLVMALEQDEIKAMFERGARIATMGSGTRKVTLSDEDMLRVRNTPVAVITYIPRINLDAAMIEKRFGSPTQRIKEKDGAIEHWLYPAKGLDIALDPKGKEVLQYVPPARFESLLRPLMEKGEVQ